jgi:hypothetical protein
VKTAARRTSVFRPQVFWNKTCFSISMKDSFSSHILNFARIVNVVFLIAALTGHLYVLKIVFGELRLN